MEDVLTVYQQPEDPKRPLVCLDEKPQPLHGEPREPLPLDLPERVVRHVNRLSPPVTALTDRAK